MAELLEFTPLPGFVDDMGSNLVWHARRGAFVYTIVFQPGIDEYCISVSYSPVCLPVGPFRSLAEAKSACTNAMMSLGN